MGRVSARAALLWLCVVVLASPLASAAAVASASQLFQGVSDPAPWFCHNLDCPPYTVVETTDDYEVRKYEAGQWVSTDMEAYSYVTAVQTGFQRLYQYIDGANKDALKIPMTAPVRNLIGASAGPFCKNNFTTSFYVPKAYQKKGAPKPNNPDVYIEDTPAFTAYVAQKGGYVMDDWSIQRMVKGLTEALEAQGVEFESESFYLAGYDPPFRLTGRHNEVWLVAKEEEQPTKQ